jgi:DNA repair protein RecO (recombination protein O)
MAGAVCYFSPVLPFDRILPMALFSTEALVLRGYKLGETSRIVVLLTRERGKLRAVARGARSGRPRYRSALEPLSEVRVSLYGRQGAELLRLGEAELLHSAFRANQQSLDASLFLSGCAELLDAFCSDGEAEDKVYRLALAVVRAAETGANPELLGRYLEAWLLKLHGLHPPLDRCASCGGALVGTTLRYHRAAHGFVCDTCQPASGPVLSSEARSLLARFFKAPPDTLTGGFEAPARELEAFHRELIGSHLERDLRAPRVIREITREGAR